MCGVDMKCNHDCFNCVYEDCINDVLTPEELHEANKRDAKFNIVFTEDCKKRWEQKNKKKISERKHQWYLLNKERCKRNRQKYYSEHREEIISREKERYQRDKEYINKQTAERKRRQRQEQRERQAV